MSKDKQLQEDKVNLAIELLNYMIEHNEFNKNGVVAVKNMLKEIK